MAIVDNLPRCEKHGMLMIRGKDECLKCVREHMDSPEGRRERAEAMVRFDQIANVVLPFGDKLKRRMLDLGKTRVRVACPDHEGRFITAGIAGSRNHLHFACEVDGCKYWLME